MLKIVDLKKEFGSEGVLKGISLNLKRGQIGALLGASGSGKTTLLRIIAGFETQDAGQVFINGQEMNRTTRPSERSVSYLFQDFALFPHMTVLENVLVALQNVSREEAYERAYAMLLLCGLLKEEKKYPDQISGGQQQRLSLARALAPRPNLLLMDEPFSNLDPELRSQLTLDVRDLIKDQGLTALMVTHLVEEAYDMADEIGIINKGVMEQWSSAHDIYRHPETEYVAQYMERASYLDVRIEKGHCFYNSIDLGKVERNVGSRLLVRPYDVVLDPSSPIVARVTNQFFRGSWVLYRLELDDGATLYAHMPSENLLDVGTKVNVRINAHLD